MVNNYDIFSKLPDNIMKVFRIEKKQFPNGDIITTYIEKRNQIIYLIQGNAELIRYDDNGNKTIIEEFNSNEILGEFFYSVNSNNELVLYAKSDIEVLIFNYDDLINKDIPKGQNYFEVISILFNLVSKKIVEKNERIEILTKRTIREKLLAYFENISSIKHRKTFNLTFSFSDLADYLCIDRSAMMREIKNLIDEGIIEKDKKKITLIEH